MSEERYLNPEELSDDGESKSVVVQNRDIPLLAGVLYIMQEIRMLEEHRDFQWHTMYNITQHLTGMPRSGSLPTGYENAFARLSEIDSQYEARCKQYVRQLRKAETILNTIDNKSMRIFVMMRYLMGYSRKAICRELNWSQRGYDRARTAVESASCMADVKWQERYILSKE